jgi:putative ABC transport system ATP-binding protein
VFVARGLYKTYGSGEAAVHALRGLDLDIAAGEFVVIPGPSGSGKSTLLNILGGLDTDGRFQFYNLIPSLAARENVELVAEIACDPVSSEEALAMVSLSDFPAQLPGGEQQRVAVARAIVKRPDALLCDEPTGALDVETGKLVLTAIARANREVGSTAIVITHNAAIEGMADRVLRMGGGRIVSVEVSPRRISPEDLAW